MSRTFSTSSTQREVIQAQGHSGSNQKSTGVALDVGGMSLLGREVRGKVRAKCCLGATPAPFPVIPAGPSSRSSRRAIPSRDPGCPRQGRMAGSVLYSTVDVDHA
ncbi:hypothetical protein GCM10027073_60310 [Streptomyces chlorus]